MTDIILIIVCSALVAGMFIVAWRAFRGIDKVGWKELDNYDERQILSRGKAFRAGFMVTAGSGMIFAILASIFDPLKVFALNFLFISAFAGLTVFGIIAIWTDSFMTEKINAGKYSAFYFVVGAAGIAGWILNRDWHTAGEFLASENLVGLLIGISFITLAVLIEVKKAMEQREEDK